MAPPLCCLAAQNGQLEVARLWLEASAEKDRPTNMGSTPFFVAARSGRLEVVRLLLQSKADKNNTLARKGETSVVVATQEGHSEVAQLLLETKTDRTGLEHRCRLSVGADSCIAV